eukprot:GEMP01025613.1.p1 GENE.GEMP01025613.1~~GEMP01025613.1.p1  ORF type:complete len:448 (+),score=70.24 GEMP01025613.1:382-1725(+)
MKEFELRTQSDTLQPISLQSPSYRGTVGEHSEHLLNTEDPAWDTNNPGDIRQTICTLVCTSLGGGALAMAVAIKDAGLLFGVSILLLTATASCVSMTILMNASAATGLKTYGFLVAQTFGRQFGLIFDVMLFLYGHGAIITYFIFLDEYLTDMFDFGGNTKVRALMLLFALVVLVPLSLSRELRAFKHLSWLSFFALCYTALVVVWYSFDETGPNVRYAKVDTGLFRCFSVCIFAYNCHLNVIPVTGELDNATPQRVDKVCMGTVAVQFVFYLFIAVGGYLSFGDKTEANILENFGKDHLLVLFARILLSISLMVSIPINLFPTVRSFLSILNVPDNDDERRIRRVSVVLMLLMDVTIAVIFPQNAQYFMEIAGSTIGSLMMLVLPACIQVRIIGAVTFREKASARFLGILAAVALVAVFVDFANFASPKKHAPTLTYGQTLNDTLF